jgi:UDP-N-acetylglucosamine:LPS N-acetylglucosamine transferase
MKVCILYSSYGAGHRAVASALKHAFEENKETNVQLIDFAIKYQIPIFKSGQKSYKFILKFIIFVQPLIVKFFDLLLPAIVYRKLFTFLSKKSMDRFVQEYSADMYISTFYTDTEIFKVIKKHNPKAKTIMVIVDIMHALRMWFDPISDITVVPTKEVYDMGLKYFRKYQKKVELFGLPVAQNIFSNISKQEIKSKLGLDEKPMVFIAGGGEGMEQVPKILNEIDKKNNDITICVICGKDTKQKNDLEKKKFNNDVKIYGWVNNFSQFVLACDIVISKAGPSTVWETLTAGKKMIIYGYIGGVEEGDAEFAIKYGDVVFEKNPEKIAQLIPEVLSKPDPLVNDRFRTNWAKEIVKRIVK